MVCGVRGHRQRQAVTIDNRHDFLAFSASRRPNLIAAALRGGKRDVDVALRLIDTAPANNVAYRNRQADPSTIISTAIMQVSCSSFRRILSAIAAPDSSMATDMLTTSGESRNKVAWRGATFAMLKILATRAST